MAIPFEWGVSDCCFWADIVRDVTGWDPIVDGRGRYDSATGARLMLKEGGSHIRPEGYLTMREAVEDRLHEIPIAHAIRGDLVFPADDLGPMASPFVLDGAHAFSKTMAGPLVLHRDRCVRAFAY